MSSIEVTVKLVASTGDVTEATRKGLAGDNMRYPGLGDVVLEVAQRAVCAAVEGARL